MALFAPSFVINFTKPYLQQDWNCSMTGVEVCSQAQACTALTLYSDQSYQALSQESMSVPACRE